VNRTIRTGLGEGAAIRGGPAPKTIPHSFGFRPRINLDKLGQLTDELEAEASREKVDNSARRQRSRSAHNADSAVHQRARRWWDACLSGVEGVGLAWAAMLGFVRISTNRRVVNPCK
jgi:hypothetical protein